MEEEVGKEEEEEEQQQQDKKVHARILLLTLILLHHPLTHGMCPWIGWVGLFMGPPVSPPSLTTSDGRSCSFF